MNGYLEFYTKHGWVVINKKSFPPNPVIGDKIEITVSSNAFQFIYDGKMYPNPTWIIQREL